MLPIFARGGGELSDYLLILSGIAAVIAYIVVAFFASLLAGAAEGLAVLWGIMLIVRRRKGAPHWFWRPMLWSVGLAAMPSLGMALNLAYAIRSADRGSSLTDSLWRQAIPVLIGLPFVLLLLGLGIVYLVRGVRELWNHGSAHASAASGSDYGGAAGSIGKRALAWILVTVGKALMTVSLFWTGIVVYTSVTGVGTKAAGDVAAALLLIVPAALVGGAAVPIWWLAREGGSLHPEESKAAAS